MATRNSTGNNPYVSRAELQALNEHFDKRFLAVDTAIKDVNSTIQHIGDKIDNLSRPKYDMLIALLGVIIIVIGMASTLVYTFISNIDQKNELRMESLYHNNNFWTKEDHQIYTSEEKKTQLKIEDELRERSISNTIEIERLKTLLEFQSEHGD